MRARRIACLRDAGQSRPILRMLLVRAKVLVLEVLASPRASRRLLRMPAETEASAEAEVLAEVLDLSWAAVPRRKAGLAASKSCLAAERSLPAETDRDLREGRRPGTAAWKGPLVARTSSRVCRRRAPLRNPDRAKGKVPEVRRADLVRWRLGLV